MTNTVQQHRIFRGCVRYLLAHSSYGAVLISTATQEEVLGSQEPEIGGGKNHWNVDDCLPIDTV